TPQEIKGVIGHEMGHLMLNHGDDKSLLRRAEYKWSGVKMFVHRIPSDIQFKILSPVTSFLKYKVLSPILGSRFYPFVDFMGRMGERIQRYRNAGKPSDSAEKEDKS